MIEITDFSSHIIWLEKDKPGGHQTSQERLFYFCAQPTRLSSEVLFLTTANYLFKPSVWVGGFSHAEGVYMAYTEDSPRFF